MGVAWLAASPSSDLLGKRFGAHWQCSRTCSFRCQELSKLGSLWRERDEPHARGTHRAHPLAKFFSFDEAPLAAAGGNVPLSPIYVTFNLNPGQPNGGPDSGFHAEPNSLQTHNVPFT